MRRFTPIPLKPDRLRISAAGKPVGVDRDKGIIYGYVMAQIGPFKSEGRGEFDALSLDLIAQLAKRVPKGLRSRFAHPTLSDDGLGKYLGRTLGQRVDGDKVRGDLHLDPTSFETPNGNLGKYVMDLAESDSDALSSSLVLNYKEEFRLDKKGRPLQDDQGNELPPLWRPTKLFASDIVDTGDAVDGLLSVEQFPDSELWQGVRLLDSAFAGQGREVIEARCHAWLNRYLGYRFGALKHDGSATGGGGLLCPLSACGGETVGMGQMAKCKDCGHTFLHDVPSSPVAGPEESTISAPGIVTPRLDSARQRLKQIGMRMDVDRLRQPA